MIPDRTDASAAPSLEPLCSLRVIGPSAADYARSVGAPRQVGAILISEWLPVKMAGGQQPVRRSLGLRARSDDLRLGKPPFNLASRLGQLGDLVQEAHRALGAQGTILLCSDASGVG